MTSRPHDALFKRTFEDPKRAGALIRSVLPRSAAQAIDWSSVRRESGSFVDAALADRHTDLLFSVRVREGQALLYLLAEHQSSPDADMPLRMLVYMTRIWEAFRREHAVAPLPPVLPFVVAHAPGGWTSPRSMHAMFDPAVLEVPQLARYVPAFELVVDDLAQLSDAALRHRAIDGLSRLACAVLRDGRDGAGLLRDLATWSDTIRALLRGPSGFDDVRSLLVYVATVSDLHIQQIRATLEEHVAEAEPVAMTTAKQLIEQGREEGREEGRRGQAELVLRMLTMRFGALDETQRTRVSNASSDDLAQIAERMLTASTLARALE